MADGRVKFIPFIESQSELFGIFRTARLLVFPSTVEAMSMVLLEAASLEVPIVCSDIPENKSVLHERAIFFQAGDASDLTAKLRWALDHPKELKKLAQSAAGWVREAYSWDSIAHRYENLYCAARGPR